jgi:hypothetical protein
MSAASRQKPEDSCDPKLQTRKMEMVNVIFMKYLMAENSGVSGKG